MAGALHLAPHRLGLGAATGVVAQPRAFLVPPVQPPQPFQFGLQLLGELRQILDVVLGVQQLLFAERPLQPVGAGGALGQAHPHPAFHQTLITHLHVLAGERRGDLGVADPLRVGAGERRQRLQVFRTGVHDQRAFGEQRHQRRRVHPGGVDQTNMLAVVHLHQGQARVVGPFAHELGVQVKRLIRSQAIGPVPQGVGAVAPDVRHGSPLRR